MPTPKKGPRLGGSPAHQRLMLANLATNLFEHGAVTTTEAKARQLRPFAERLITKAKRGDLHNRRQVLSIIRDKGVVHVLFTEIGPKFAERPGGYTRITKIGPRKGDNAPMAVIELVEEDFTPQARSAKPAASTPAASAPSDETVADTPDEAEPELTDEQQAVAEQEPTGEPVAEAVDEEPVAEAVDEEPGAEAAGADESDAESPTEADAGPADETDEADAAAADDTEGESTEQKSS